MTHNTTTPNWKPITNSSFIQAVAWVYTGHVGGKMVGSMVIVMSSGTYRYDLVPIHIYAAFHRSTSKGSAYNRLIKGCYASLCLTSSRPRRQPKPRYGAVERRARRNAEALFPQYNRQVAA